MQIVEKKVTELKAYEKNPRKNDNAVGPVAESIKEFGFKVPIIVDKDNVIVAGHTRLRAAKKLGMKTVPCIVADDLTPDQIKAFRVADNSTAQIAEWDLSLLKDELTDLDFDMSIFGLEKEVKDIERIFAPEIIEDDVPEVDEKNIITKMGDIWQLGRHRIMCGDSTKEEDVAKLMNGNKADMVFTDPPYGVKYEARTGIRSGKVRDNMKMILNDDLEGDELQDFINVAIRNLKLATKENAPFYVCNNWRCLEVFIKSFKKCKLSIDAFIVWNKDWMSVGHGDYRSNHEFIFYSKRGSNFYAPKGTENDVWTIRKLSPDKKTHTTEKPVGVSGRAIKNSSTNGSLVLDLFGGSGSTLIACEQLNRSCYMMELDPKYCDVIIKRYIAFKGTSDDVYRINADGTKTKYEDIIGGNL